MPCSSSSSPASGIAALTGQIGGLHGEPVVSPCRNDVHAIVPPTQTSAPT